MLHKIQLFFPKNKLSKEMTRYSFIMFIQTMATVCLNFLYTVLLARVIGAKSFGLLTISMASVGFIGAILGFTTVDAVVKYGIDSIDSDKPSVKSVVLSAYLIDFLQALILFAIIFSSSRFIALHIFHEQMLTDLIRIYATFLLVCWPVGASIGIMQIYKRFSLISFLNTLASFLKLVFCMALAKYGLQAIVFGHVLSSLLFTIVAVSFSSMLMNKYMHNVRHASFISNFKNVFAFSLQRFLALTVKSFLQHFDVLFLGYMKTPVQVSYYKIGLAISGILGFISSPISQVIYPYLVEMQKEESQRFTLFIKKLTMMISIIAIPAGSILILTGKYVVLFLYSKEFSPAVSILPLTVCVAVLSVTFCWEKPVFLSLNKPEVLAKITFLMAITMVAFSFVLVPYFGYIGSAIAYCIAHVLNYTLTIILLKKSLHALNPLSKKS